MALIEVIGPVYQGEIGFLLYNEAERQMVGTWEIIWGYQLVLV